MGSAGRADVDAETDAVEMEEHSEPLKMTTEPVCCGREGAAASTARRDNDAGRNRAMQREDDLLKHTPFQRNCRPVPAPRALVIICM